MASGTYTHTINDTAALDSFANLTGTLVATDRDTADTLVWSGSQSGAFGELTVNANGSYSYAVNAAAVNALQLGSNPSESFTATVTDSKGATDTRTITINLVGADDTPVAQADTANATEAGGVANAKPGIDPIGNVLQNDSDPDLNDSKTVTSVSAAGAGIVGGLTAGTYGQLTLGVDGHYSYQVDNKNQAVQALRQASDTLVDTFRYTMQDAHGASSSASLTVTLHGANDAPQAFDDAGAVSQGKTLTQTAAQGVLANDVDVDGSAYGETMTVAQVAQASNVVAVAQGTPARLVSSYGTLTLSADGSYTYLADGAGSKALWFGDTAVDTFTYTIRDSAGLTASATLSLKISGVNLPTPPSAPIVRAETAGTTPAPTPVTASGAVTPTASLPSVTAASMPASFTPGTAGPSGTASDSTSLSSSATPTNFADARSGTVALHSDQQAMQGSTSLTGDAGGPRKLESTDRGFQVERIQTQSALSVSIENQQKGGDRLFVYKGIGSTTSETAQMMEYRVPKDAFAHTNSASVVQLEASLVDGAPLPQWLDFDPTSGAFSGRPPTDAGRVLVIKVTARDEQGRETSTTFTIRIEGKQNQSRALGADPMADTDTLDSPEEAIQVLAQRSQATKRGSVPFSDQLRLSRHDPLVAKILSRQTASVHSKSIDGRLG